MRSIKLPPGMTHERLAALELIDSNGPVSVSDLAAFASVRVPSMSRMVTSLVEEGLARKRGMKDDARGVLISLTPKGKRAYQVANRKAVEHLERALGRLSPGQISALTSLAKALSEVSAKAS